MVYSCAPPQLSSEWNDPLVLHQFLPAWAILAFLRFHPSLNVHVVNARFPSYAATGALPQLQDGHFRLGGGTLNILLHLQTHHLPPDDDDPPRPDHVVLCQALSQVISTTGQALLNASAFGHGLTYAEITRPQIMAQSLFPVSTFAAQDMRQTAVAHSRAQLSLCVDNDDLRVFQCARDFYQLLCDQLQLRQDAEPSCAYFSGHEHPSCVDALVFGHLVQALRLPHLATVVPQALRCFAQHIRQVYFPDNVDLRALSLLDNDDDKALPGDIRNTTMMIVQQPVSWIQTPYQSLSAGFRQRSIVQTDNDGDTRSRDRKEEQEQAAALESQGRRFLVGMAVTMVCYLSSMIQLDDDEDHEEMN